MDIDKQAYKDVSKVFSNLRAQLNEKEKELLELQRAEPSLLAPDLAQIKTIIDGIASLHLSTQDGSFLFASTKIPNSEQCSIDMTTARKSTGVDSIKTLPSNVWISEQKSVKVEENAYRLPMVTHILSLPLNAFLSNSPVSSDQSSSFTENVAPKTEPTHRLPVVSQLLSAPLDTFISVSTTNPTLNERTNLSNESKPLMKGKALNELSISPQTSKSILDGDSVYSKEFWLRSSNSSSKETNSTAEKAELFDLDKYIEEASDKMRRLHLEYLSAMDQIKSSSTNTINSLSAMKSIYPHVFDRIQADLPVKTQRQTGSSSK